MNDIGIEENKTEPFYLDDYVTLYHGDSREVLRTLPDASVNCCVTSPPYYGLRSYMPDAVKLRDGLTPEEREYVERELASLNVHPTMAISYRKSEIPDHLQQYFQPLEIGLEQTPQEYVDELVAVFREVRRVLRDDGTLWLNLGDSYNGYMANQHGTGLETKRQAARKYIEPGAGLRYKGLKNKDLIGIPWRMAFALQADGWVLRQDIVWSKPNPMPESVRDRCTKSHEMIFLFSKAKWIGGMPPRRMKRDDARWLAILLETEGNIAIRRYTHNRETPQHAVQIAIANSDISILQEARRIAGCGSILTTKGCNRPVYYLQWTTKEAAGLLWEMYPFLFGKKRQAAIGLMLESRRSNRNKGVRDDIFNKDGRHFYLKPEEIELREKMWKAVKALNKHEPVDLSWLIEPKEGRWDSQHYYFDNEAIKEQAVGRNPGNTKPTKGGRAYADGDDKHRTAANLHEIGPVERRNKRSVWTVATKPFKGAHFATYPPDLIKPCILAGCPVGGTVIDPFAGSGTTGRTAKDMQRKSILVELNKSYCEIATARITG